MLLRRMPGRPTIVMHQANERTEDLNLKNLEQSLEERTQRVGSLTTMEERDARLRSLERTLKNDKNGWRYESGGGSVSGDYRRPEFCRRPRWILAAGIEKRMFAQRCKLRFGLAASMNNASASPSNVRVP